MTTEADGIRPFSVDFPEDALLDLRRRINATRWPGQETVNDHSQGVRLATMQDLAALLGDGVRLAQMRGDAESPTALRDRD